MTDRIGTGVPGLDAVLAGGFPPGRMYLVQGEPGAGKTTLALQFLLEGVARGEPCLFVSLSETREELAAAALSHGWSLDGVAVHEIANVGGPLHGDEENTLYTPGEVELGERVRRVLAEVDRLAPTRVVVDSCTELRLLAQTPLRFRRQILALKENLIARNCTVLLIENPLTPGGDPLLQSLVHGILVLEQVRMGYGSDRRRLRISKLRAVAYSAGSHDVAIKREGLVVFPRLVAAEHHEPFASEPVSSGVPEIDTLVGGGLDRGTAALVMGPAGSGKSALTTQYCIAAAERGEHSAIFAFDEGLGTMRTRSAQLGQDLAGHVGAGRIRLQQVDPAELSPGEFVHRLRDAVERGGAKVIVIDSLNGYLHAMPDEPMLALQLHEVLMYLRQRGVVTLLVLAQTGLIGGAIGSPIDLSYLADDVILTRFFEAQGRVRKAISVVKKRSGRHENTIREFSLSERGFTVSEPLTQFHGVLGGTPVMLETDFERLRA